MDQESHYPTYELVEACPEGVKVTLHVLTKQEAENIPEAHRTDFNEHSHVVHHENGSETHWMTPCKASKYHISKNTFVKFSEAVSSANDYFGVASDLLAFHKYTRKSTKSTPLKVYLPVTTKDVDSVLNLVRARNQNREHCNGRGDEEGVPAFFEKLAREFAEKHKLELTVIKGDDLVKDGFRLLHAVGRASKNTPTFINIKYNGNPDSDKWVAFVGKGVCFDTGGLNIKPTSGIKEMYLDKSGAVSVFTAFQYIVQEGLKINLTVSMGMVENYLGSNAYRPSDIIASRKGVTVEIGNTDCQGRLVLADCMNWTQEKYKTEILIELSTLTGAIIIALGTKYAGLFTNSKELKDDLMSAGEQVHEQSWHMPVSDYYRDLIKHKEADITNMSGKPEGSSCQAAAFLEKFVEKDTKWIHLDIAGTTIIGSEGTGYGARLLIQYARNYVKK